MSLQLRIMRWFWLVPDRVLDRFSWAHSRRSDKLWEAFSFVEDQVAALLCRVYGHKPERDQCGIPEHDFCFYCKKRMPHSYMI